MREKVVVEPQLKPRKQKKIGNDNTQQQDPETLTKQFEDLRLIKPLLKAISDM
jgi:hypothetical protein